MGNKFERPDQDPWSALLGTYRSYGVVLALGAGVSTCCRIPGWPELLNRIASKCVGATGPVLVNELRRTHHFSLPAIAGTLEGLCPPGLNYTEIIRDSLYETFPYYERSGRSAPAVPLEDFVRECNPTMAAVAALCVVTSAEPLRGDTRTAPPFFVANRRIHAIINTNFDAVLTRYLAARYGRTPLRTIDRPSAGSSSTRIHTYHIHGFFQFQADRIGDPESEAPDIRVLTEQDFFDFFNAPTSVYSYVFLHSLRQHSVLFVGMSLQDDNVRRLLHYSYRERVGSYMKEGLDASEALVHARRHFALLPRPAASVSTAVEGSLARLGVHPIWFDDYSEIVTRLARLYAAGGDSWPVVYDGPSSILSTAR